MATIYLNNITKETVQWSIDYGSDNVDGDQQGLSFQQGSAPFAENYTVCYWTDPSTRHCATVQDGDAVIFTGAGAVHTVGG